MKFLMTGNHKARKSSSESNSPKQPRQKAPAVDKSTPKKFGTGLFTFRSLATKIVTVVIAVLILVVALCVSVTAIQSNAFADQIIAGQVTKANTDFAQTIVGLNDDWQRGIESVLKNSMFTGAVGTKNQSLVSLFLEEHATRGADFVIVTDAKGIVLHTNNEAHAPGDDISGEPYVSAALSGNASSGIYTDSDSNIFYATALPVKSSQPQPVGVVIGTNYLNKDELLDALKQTHGVDFTLFKGDVCWATTIVQNGERTVGTLLDPAIADIVLEQGADHAGKTQILGQPYSVMYSPIRDGEGNAVGALFAGLPLAEIELERTNMVVNSVLITLALVVVSIIGILLFARKSIRKPLLQMCEGAAQLAAGNTEMALKLGRRHDEIGMLATAFKSVTDALNALIEDSTMLVQAAVEGRLSARADVARHQGGYAQIVEGVNQTLDAVIAPVNEAARVLNEMSRGNLDVSVTGDFKGDHAIIQQALNKTIDTIKGYIAEISDVLGALCEGDLTVEIQTKYLGDFTRLKESINRIAASLNDVFTDINAAAAQVAAGTRQVSDGSQAISQGATEQASAIEELNATVSEIAAQTKQNAANAGKANELALVAKDFALNGDQQMQAMQKAMGDINETSVNISRIIKVIDEIAFQTNILSLNAAVEAAHAGVHGRGFAVVAEEVRNLAARSAQAAQETTGLIEDSVKKASAGTQIVSDTAKALGDIVDSVEKAVQLVGEIAQASNEQATGIAQIDRGITQMADVVQTNSATSEQSAATAEELSSQAELLRDMVARFLLREQERLSDR